MALARTASAGKPNPGVAAINVYLQALAVLAGSLHLASCGPEPLALPLTSVTGEQYCFVRHVIDGSGSGADGVHLGDINDDGYPDVVSGWEESGLLRVYLHPGPAVVARHGAWPYVDVSGGQDLSSIEDAAFADLDLDGRIDAVVTATEGMGAHSNRRIRIHAWDRTGPLEEPGSWRGRVIHLDAPMDRFLAVRAAQLDGRHGADIVAISRSLFEDPADSGEVTTMGGLYLYRAPPPLPSGEQRAWPRQRLAEFQKGKVIELVDMDADGDKDILYAGARNVVWLENPLNDARDDQWTSHWVGTASDLALCDINADGHRDIVATVGRREYPVVARWFEGIADDSARSRQWRAHDIVVAGPAPMRFFQLDNAAVKGIACGHLVGASTGPADIVLTASGSGYGMVALLAPEALSGEDGDVWRLAPLMAYQWVMKFDNVLSVDMDADGDLDLVTSEENEGWWLRGAGVLWFENVPAVDGVCPVS